MGERDTDRDTGENREGDTGEKERERQGYSGERDREKERERGERKKLQTQKNSWNSENIF